MHEILAHDGYLPRTYLPFSLPGRDSDWGCRFGGKPPAGVRPPFDPYLYLLTLQYSVDPHVEFSVFLDFSVSHREDHFDVLAENKYQMFDASSPEGLDLLHIVTHQASARDDSATPLHVLPPSAFEYAE